VNTDIVVLVIVSASIGGLPLVVSVLQYFSKTDPSKTETLIFQEGDTTKLL
jgi:hypothetical protein